MTENKIQNDSIDDNVSLKEIFLKIREWWKYLLSKWLVILGFGILGGVIGFVYAYFKKPIYIATTSFVLEEGNKGGGLSGLAGIASVAGVGLGGNSGSIFQGDNILELYKSRSMIEKTLLTSFSMGNKQTLLIDRFIEFNKLRENWKNIQNVDFSKNNSILKTNTRLSDSLMGVIVNDIRENYLKVEKPDKLLTIIKADVKSKDEIFAKMFNEEIVKNVNDFYVQTKTKKSIANVKLLQQKADSVNKVMNGSIYRAVEIADATPNLNITRQIQRIAPIQRSQFSAEMNKLVLSSVIQNLEMAKMELSRDQPLIQVIDNPVFPLEKEKLSKLVALIYGGLIFGFISVIVLVARKIIKEIGL